MNAIDLNALPANVRAEVEKLQRENERLSAARGPKPMTMKVSGKGALSVYGLQRFPVTLYREQWERILNAADEIRAFIAVNDRRLTLKGEE